MNIQELLVVTTISSSDMFGSIQASLWNLLSVLAAQKLKKNAY